MLSVLFADGRLVLRAGRHGAMSAALAAALFAGLLNQTSPALAGSQFIDNIFGIPDNHLEDFLKNSEFRFVLAGMSDRFQAVDFMHKALIDNQNELQRMKRKRDEIKNEIQAKKDSIKDDDPGYIKYQLRIVNRELDALWYDIFRLPTARFMLTDTWIQYLLERGSISLDDVNGPKPLWDVVQEKRAELEAKQSRLEAEKERLHREEHRIGLTNAGIAGLEADLKNLEHDIALKEKEIEDNLKAIRLLETTNGASNGEATSRFDTGSGQPYLADPLSGAGNIRWWGGATASHLGAGTGVTEVDGALALFATGADIRVGPDSVIGFGLGLRHGAADGVTGNNLDLNGVTVFARAAKGLTRDVWLDGVAFYGHDWISFNYGFGAVDSYGVHRAGFGAGVNVRRRLGPMWRADGRLGWTGVWSDRGASTDSFGFPRLADQVATGRASAWLRLTRLFDGGEVFAEAELRAVTNDTSIFNFDNNPIDGEIGGGVHLNLGGTARLTARGYAVVGRNGYSEYGGTGRVGVSF